MKFQVSRHCLSSRCNPFTSTYYFYHTYLMQQGCQTIYAAYCEKRNLKLLRVRRLRWSLELPPVKALTLSNLRLRFSTISRVNRLAPLLH